MARQKEKERIIVQSVKRGDEMHYNKDGWIYSGNRSNEVHLISEEDINQLLSLSDEDDA